MPGDALGRLHGRRGQGGGLEKREQTDDEIWTNNLDEKTHLNQFASRDPSPFLCRSPPSISSTAAAVQDDATLPLADVVVPVQMLDFNSFSEVSDSPPA